MSQTTDIDLHGKLPARRIFGVDVIFEPTRSAIEGVTSDRPGTPTAYVDERGFRVYRWVFDKPLEADVQGPHLRVAFTGEPPVPAWIQPLSIEDTDGQPPTVLGDGRHRAIRKWFEHRKAEIERDKELGRAALFFLELDRVTRQDLLPATLELELPASDITKRITCLDTVGADLSQRLFWRVSNLPQRVIAVPISPNDIDNLSDLLMHLLGTFFEDRAGGPPAPSRVLEAFKRFAAGDFAHREVAHSNGLPDTYYFFYFAEFALVASRPRRLHATTWGTLLGPLVMTQRIYIHAHGPPPIPFLQYKGRPTRQLLDDDRKSLVKGWDRHETPDGWDDQIQQNVWEASQGVW